MHYYWYILQETESRWKVETFDFAQFESGKFDSKLPKYGLYWQHGRNLRQFREIQAKSNLCHNFAYDAIAGGISGRLFWILNLTRHLVLEPIQPHHVKSQFNLAIFKTPYLFQKVIPQVLITLFQDLSDGTLTWSKIKLEVILNWMSKENLLKNGRILLAKLSSNVVGHSVTAKSKIFCNFDNIQYFFSARHKTSKQFWRIAGRRRKWSKCPSSGQL